MTGLVNETASLDTSGFCIFYNSKAVVLKLSVTTSLGLHVRYPPFQIFTLGFITVIKLQLRSINKTNFMAGVITTCRTVLKGPSAKEAKKQCSEERRKKTEQTAVTQTFRRPTQEDGPRPCLKEANKQTERF